MMRTSARIIALLFASGLALTPAPAAAQSPLPTLSDVGYVSPGGAVQLSFAGRLDVEAYLPGSDPTWLMTSTDPFVTGRLRFFTDLFIGSSLYASAELRADGGEVPQAGEMDARMEQLFLRWTPARHLSVQAGKFVSPFGSYPSRHHTSADPFIRPPLHYEYRTMVSSRILPPNSGAFVQWKTEPDEFRPVGAPPVWGAPYQWGGMVSGGVGAFDYRVAALNSAPSSEPAEWGWDTERMKRPSLVAGVGYRFSPSLRADVHHNRGPWLAMNAEGPLAGGAELWDYDQVLWGVEVLFERGRTVLRGEALHDRWEVPNVDVDPVDIAWSLEARQRLSAGLFMAARLGAIDFNRIPFSAHEYNGTFFEAGAERWDHPVRRLQLGAGYRLVQNAEVRVEYLFSRTRGTIDPRDDLLSLQLWWEF